MNPILQPILQSPRLRSYVKELEDFLKSEDERRQFFYNHVSEKEKAEFINGEIVVHLPVRLIHNEVLKYLIKAIDDYVTVFGLGFVGYEKILIKLTRNDYEPDLCFFGNEKAAKFTPDQMFFPIPDLIIEVLSESTEKTDRGIKLEDYALHGLKEYWIVEPARQFIEQYFLTGENLLLHKIYNEGTIKSEVIKGIEFPVQAAFDVEVNKKFRMQFLR